MSSSRQLLTSSQAVLNKANEETVTQVVDFVSSSRASGSSKLSAGLISAGPNIASHSTLSRQIETQLRSSGANIFVNLSSSECSNLKSLLKTLIAKATRRNDDEDELHSSVRKGPKLLNYDLQLLQEHVKDNGVENVVVAFQDTEAFDSHVMSDAIELFGIWDRRIPFVLLFSVATSIGAHVDALGTAKGSCAECCRIY